MPLVLDDIDHSGDTPELQAFKKMVVKTATEFASNYGHQDATRRALRELGLVDPTNVPVTVDADLRMRFHFDADFSQLKARNEAARMEYLSRFMRDHIGRRNTGYIEFVNGMTWDRNHDLTVTVVDANRRT